MLEAGVVEVGMHLAAAMIPAETQAEHPRICPLQRDNSISLEWYRMRQSVTRE